MAHQTNYRAILFPVQGVPTFVDLLVSIVPGGGLNGAAEIRAHPEIFMTGTAPWVTQRFNSLFGMTQPLPNPFVAYYTPRPAAEAKPINNSIARAQDGLFQVRYAWRGEVVVAKCSSANPAVMINCEPADFPIVQNYFSRANPAN